MPCSVSLNSGLSPARQAQYDASCALLPQRRAARCCNCLHRQARNVDLECCTHSQQQEMLPVIPSLPIIYKQMLKQAPPLGISQITCMGVAELLTSLPVWRRPSTCNGVHSCLWCRECLISLECHYACGAGNASVQWIAFMLVVQGMPHHNTVRSFLWFRECLTSASANTASGQRYVYLSNLNRTCLAWQLLWLGRHHLGQGCLASAELPQRLSCQP